MQVKKLAPKKAQVLAEAGETLKSVRNQILPELAQDNSQEVVAGVAQSHIRKENDSVRTPEESAKLEALRRRLQVLQEEELEKARFESQEAYRTWKENVSEALEQKEGGSESSHPIPETGSKKRGAGIFGAIKGKVSKAEMGRRKG